MIDGMEAGRVTSISAFVSLEQDYCALHNVEALTIPTFAPTANSRFPRARSWTKSAGRRNAGTQMPKTSDELIAFLDGLDIANQTIEHPPLFTVEDSQNLRGEIEGGHTKNLFVKDKKSRLFLLVLGEETVVDLKRVHEKIGGQGRVSFGSAELLEEVWGVKPGSVTPFALVNDQTRQVKLVLDRGLAEGGPVNAHPLTNSMTTAIAPADLTRFFDSTGHVPQWLDFPP